MTPYDLFAVLTMLLTALLLLVMTRQVMLSAKSRKIAAHAMPGVVVATRGFDTASFRPAVLRLHADQSLTLTLTGLSGDIEAWFRTDSLMLVRTRTGWWHKRLRLRFRDGSQIDLQGSSNAIAFANHLRSVAVGATDAIELTEAENA